MKTVLITGGSRGIGEALVREFYSSGYKVVFLYKRSYEKAERLCAELDGVKAYACDVSNETQVRKIVSEILSTTPVDVLINNAGVSFEGLITDMSLDDWHRVIDNNLTSAFLVCREIIPHFVSKKSGKIINISSMWGQVGASCEVAYSASKAGIDGLTKALAKELAPCSVTVNAIAPGVIDTDMMKDFSDDDVRTLCEETPLSRIGKGSDVAKAALFLAEDSGDFITGQIIGVNGGFVI